MTLKELIDQVFSLPVEDRALMVDLLLRSLNPPNKVIDEKWILEAQKRLQEKEEGKVVPIPGETVFQKIWDRFEK